MLAAMFGHTEAVVFDPAVTGSRMMRLAIRRERLAQLGYVTVPLILFGLLLVASVARRPQLLTNEGIAGALIVLTPMILGTLALTPITLVGRGSINLVGRAFDRIYQRHLGEMAGRNTELNRRPRCSRTLFLLA